MAEDEVADRRVRHRRGIAERPRVQGRPRLVQLARRTASLADRSFAQRGLSPWRGVASRAGTQA
jgi:hypothetical protein